MLKLLYTGAPVRYIGRSLEVGCADCHHRFGVLSRKWTNGLGTAELTNATGRLSYTWLYSAHRDEPNR